MNRSTNPNQSSADGHEISTGDGWLDKQDILTRLHISGRTLQRWRTKGIIPFTRIRKKIFYKESDLKKTFEQYRRH
jgi:predicted site-specific integrase-resolvase